MKKIICILTVAFLIPHSVWAATLLGCKESSSKYTACKPGYYLSNGTCLDCPERRDEKGNIINPGIISADKNTVGITACYQQTGGTYEYSDNTGTFILSGTGKCSHN